MTAPAAGAVTPGASSRSWARRRATSSTARPREVPGMCGVVDGGIVAGLWGYEAGQSGVGDIFGWFVDNCVPAAYRDEAEAHGVICTTI